MFPKALLDFLKIFKRKKKINLGIYGPPNAGKSTLANQVVKDILGEEKANFSESSISHETREVQQVEKLHLERKGKTIDFTLMDTPGITTKVDYEEFVKKGMKKTEAKERAKEATQGVVESIKWLDNVDAVIVVLDATKNPYNQVNITLVGNLVAKGKKIIVVANKTDLKKSNVEKVKLVFPDYTIVPVSAKTREGMEEMYEAIFKEFS